MGDSFCCAHWRPPMVRVANATRISGRSVLNASQQCWRVTSTGVSMNVFILVSIERVGLLSRLLYSGRKCISNFLKSGFVFFAVGASCLLCGNFNQDTYCTIRWFASAQNLLGHIPSKFIFVDLAPKLQLATGECGNNFIAIGLMRGIFGSKIWSD